MSKWDTRLVIVAMAVGFSGACGGGATSASAPPAQTASAPNACAAVAGPSCGELARRLMTSSDAETIRGDRALWATNEIGGVADLCLISGTQGFADCVDEASTGAATVDRCLEVLDAAARSCAFRLTATECEELVDRTAAAYGEADAEWRAELLSQCQRGGTPQRLACVRAAPSSAELEGCYPTGHLDDREVAANVSPEAADFARICRAARDAAALPAEERRTRFAEDVLASLVSEGARNTFNAAGAVESSLKQAVLARGADELGVPDWQCPELAAIYGPQTSEAEAAR